MNIEIVARSEALETRFAVIGETFEGGRQSSALLRFAPFSKPTI
jgi:hypothetical protein